MTQPISQTRAAILAALPQPGLQPRDSDEARLAERLLQNAERDVRDGATIEEAAQRVWDRWVE